MSMIDNQTSPPARPSSARRGLGTPGVDLLWALLTLTLIGAYIALVPTPPNDFWWHLKAGQITATQGIPTTNLFAWSLPADHPYIYATWLGEWLFYTLYKLGGLQAPVLARNLLGLAGFTLVALEARRRSGSWRLAAIVTLLAGAMASNNLPTRTQNWSWVPFGLYVLILGAYAAGQARPRVLLALPLLMAFWVNAHGAFVLGLALLGLATAGETMRRLLRQPNALGWERLRWLYLALFGTFAATLVNPLGPGIFGYVVKLLTDPPSQGLIIEWQPPTTQGLAGFSFYISILAILVVFTLNRRRPTFTDMLLLCAFLWLAWTGQRYVVWYGMVAMPMLAESLATLQPAGAVPLARSRMRLPSIIISLMLLGLLIAVQPPFKARLALPEPYQALFADVPGAPGLYGADTPVAAAEYLRTHPIDGRMFNEMGYGSYFDWALYPAMQVFIDPRVELYPLALWQDYLAIRDARNYNALLIDKYAIRRVVLDRVALPRLAAALASDTRWEREYADTRAEIYRRR